ncbi:MAG: hypothetical protein GC137_10510 [Alphaproteobacteria bacterium]|nr:hypothetical protein [Alphaproteobacteria bacterium]
MSIETIFARAFAATKENHVFTKDISSQPQTVQDEYVKTMRSVHKWMLNNGMIDQNSGELSIESGVLQFKSWNAQVIRVLEEADSNGEIDAAVFDPRKSNPVSSRVIIEPH